ncbi:TRAP transporter small permease [Bacillus sp. B15-48]|uniref:TRAP transporter small permease n=1 Tax=Bacillus sp. B15-48 TaxID=1548601 RepID=UPI00193F9522|nr:TRAP transporter small permease [Bacillus sp. B15-48]MBM4761492.1 TRAP transporter small permease subunit [Bacillus sp. B15-48]
MKKLLDKVVGTFSVVLLAAMVVMALWQVFTRFILNSPSTFTEEFLRFSLIWLTMVGGAYVLGQKKHLAIVFFARKLPQKSQLAVTLLVEAFVILFAVVIMILGGMTAFQNAMGQVSPSLRMPMEYLYLSLPVGGVMFLLYSLLDIAKVFSDRKRAVEHK